MLRGPVTQKSTARDLFILVLALVSAAAAGCSSTSTAAPTAADARAFLDNVDATFTRLSLDANRAGWIGQNFITEDTEAMDARTSQAIADAASRFAKEAVRFDKVTVPADQRRQLDLLKVSLVLATPSDPKEAEELTRLVSSMRGAYGKGKWCADPAKPDKCMNIDDVTKVLATSRNEKDVRAAWEGWHTISPPIRKDYQRFAELSNKGAKELGFADTGAMWRAKYDMAPDDFTKELDRLWEQVRPLYLQLHAYVRLKLHQKYGDAVALKGPVPAHLTGNIWAQDWSNIYDLVGPANADPGFSLTNILERRKMAALDMVRAGERFYTSIGFEALPKTFWERSLFVRPRDREVVCHASAWDIDNLDRRAHQDVHHADGRRLLDDPPRARPQLLSARLQGAADHLPRQRERRLPRSDWRHDRALGHARVPRQDRAPRQGARRVARYRPAAVARAREGRVPAVWPADRSVAVAGLLGAGQAGGLQQGLVGRSGSKYQGIAPPSARGEEFFDPGAKYHVPDNTPYTRYFLADILQFQFHRALSKAAGCTTPLHRCSIYESKEAGKGLNAMLSMGLSQAVARSAQRDDRLARRWMRPRSSTTSRRFRSGSKSRTRDRRSAGSRSPSVLLQRQRQGEPSGCRVGASHLRP